MARTEFQRPGENNAVHSLTYMPQLDSLRAISVLLVIYTHFWPENLWLFGIYWGGLGVRCFFVLSGFLITSILLRDDRPFGSLYAAFISRRAIRLYPILLVTLAVAFALNIGTIKETIPWNATYLTNFYIVVVNAWPRGSQHLWSLAVEEQFYLVWPFVIFFVPRRFLPPVFVALILFAIAFRIVWRALGWGDLGAWILPPGSFDALAMGALLAFCGGKIRYLEIAAGVCVLIYAACVPYMTPPTLFRHGPESWLVADVEIHQTVAAVVFAWIIAKASVGFKGIIGKVLDFPTLRYLGMISYGIYVLHGFVFEYVRTHEVRGTKIVSVIVTIGLAALSWHFLERPIKRIGRKAITAYTPPGAT